MFKQAPPVCLYGPHYTYIVDSTLFGGALCVNIEIPVVISPENVHGT